MSWNTLYLIDVVAFLFFLLTYYRNCYRKGYRIDFWNSQVFLFCVIPSMFLLPFGQSELNGLVVGRDLVGVVQAIPIAFSVAMIGFVSLYFGSSLWRYRLGIGLRASATRFLDLGPRCSLMLMSSRDVLVILSLFCLCLQGLMLSIYFAHNGFGLDLRAYTFANPGLRPFAQITALSTVVVASHCLARFVDTKEKILLVSTLVLSFGLLFFGQRTNIALVFMNVVLCALVKLRARIGLFRIVFMVAGVIGLGFYLGNVRDGQYSIAEFFGSIAFLALYGNTFCDLRDFAWIYTNWNHQFWMGRTYLAGLAAFIPRGTSEFRNTWTFGVATDWTVGLDTELHPGLKPGLFGEGFFNFGLLGAVTVGIVFGLILRKVDSDVKEAFASGRQSMMKAFSSTMLLTVAGCFNTSLGLPALYALLGIYGLAWVFLKAKALVSARGQLHTESTSA